MSKYSCQFWKIYEKFQSQEFPIVAVPKLRKVFWVQGWVEHFLCCLAQALGYMVKKNLTHDYFALYLK